MKTASILTSLLLSFFFSVNAQQTALDLPQGWEISSSWLQTYQSNISANGSATWILDKMSDEARLYTGKNADGIVLILEEEMEDYTLAEAAEMAVIEAGGMNLIPASDASPYYAGYKVDFYGKISGTPVFMEKIVLPSTKPGYMVTILAISNRASAVQNVTFAAANELASQLDSANGTMARK